MNINTIDTLFVLKNNNNYENEKVALLNYNLVYFFRTFFYKKVRVECETDTNTPTHILRVLREAASAEDGRSIRIDLKDNNR